MDIGEIVSDAIKYPSQKWGKIIILGIILIIPIVNFIGLGYLFRVLKATFAGIDDVPEFDEAGELFVDGLKILVVGFVYAIPVMIIGAIISFIFGSSAGSVSSFDMFAILAGSLVYVIIAIIIGLIESIAIANMALYEGELGAAFKFSEVMDRISAIGWGKYIVWYIVMVLLAFVAALIAGATSIIIIGYILVPLIIIPYFGMFSARSLALLFASSEEDQQAL